MQKKGSRFAGLLVERKSRNGEQYSNRILINRIPSAPLSLLFLWLIYIAFVLRRYRLSIWRIAIIFAIFSCTFENSIPCKNEDQEKKRLLRAGRETTLYRSLLLVEGCLKIKETGPLGRCLIGCK